MSKKRALRVISPLISNPLLVAALTAVLLVAGSRSTFGEELPAKTFATTDQACQALYDAVKNGAEKEVERVLGLSPELTSSADTGEGKLQKERFAQKYQEMHRLVREPDRTTVLYIGAENWPFPIPLVEADGRWHFDSDAGSQEILARTIGENEATAIQVCRGLKKATGQKTNTYSGDPIQPFVNSIVNAGTSNHFSGPFHGYYFRTVAQEPVGVVLVAYPAEYRVSGVMTFLVVVGGHVYEKDLGPKTPTLAAQIQGKPAGKWYPVQQSKVTGPSKQDYMRCLENTNCDFDTLLLGDKWDRVFDEPVGLSGAE